MTVDLTLGVRCVTLYAIPTRPTLGPVASEADQTQSLTLTPTPIMPSDRGGEGNRKSWGAIKKESNRSPDGPESNGPGIPGPRNDAKA